MWGITRLKKSTLYLLIGIVILAVAPIYFPTYWIQMLSQVLIMALFATSINIEMGYAGMMPMGQTTFFGFGAYAYGILFLKGGVSMPLAIILTLVLSLLVNIIIGTLCLRGKAFTFGLLHMGFNLLAAILVTKWIGLTGGDPGMTGIPRPEIFSSPLAFYFMVLGVVVICYIIIRMIMNSPFGRMSQGLRENEERLIFLGVNTKRYQLVIFVIAGFFSAVAGILLAMLNRGAFPSYISILLSAQGMMMCLIGGMFSFMGPSLGACIIVLFSNITAIYTRQYSALLGVIMIVSVLTFRGGILRSKKIGILGKKKPNLDPNVKANAAGSSK